MTVYNIVANTQGRTKVELLKTMDERQRQMDKLDEYKDTIDNLNIDRKTRISMIDKFIEDNNLYMLKL